MNRNLINILNEMKNILKLTKNSKHFFIKIDYKLSEGQRTGPCLFPIITIINIAFQMKVTGFFRNFLES